LGVHARELAGAAGFGVVDAQGALEVLRSGAKGGAGLVCFALGLQPRAPETNKLGLSSWKTFLRRTPVELVSPLEIRPGRESRQPRPDLPGRGPVRYLSGTPERFEDSRNPSLLVPLPRW
jgi:hypothetical protein